MATLAEKRPIYRVTKNPYGDNEAAASIEADERKKRRQAAAAAAAATAKTTCPNKSCPKPNVVDGTCQTCGRVADDSNIVAEVQFGETSSGAAVVQGTFVGADQAGARSMGPAFPRRGPFERLDKSVLEARGMMQGFAQQLNIGDNLVTAGTQVFKLASGANFVQGRTMESVSAVCLYAACRIQPPCKVMLIDFADLIQVNVFKLGRAFKKLNEAVPLSNDSLSPVYPEDLIWRFATKMEFYHDTAKVAEDAVRLVKRMRRDWMVMGRRPSGICGACLLMAARMHNFRRTVREVVYIVKVTNHTIQSRLEEFTLTDSSKMSVEDFLKQDFLESSHDPPAFYRQSEEYQKQVEAKSRGRKRRRLDAAEDGDESDLDDQDPDTLAQQDSSATHQATTTQPSGADLSAAPVLEFRRDADGFIIPPLPSQIAKDDAPASCNNNDQNTQDQGDDAEESLDDLAKEYGDEMTGEVEEETDARPSGRRANESHLPINDEWRRDEQELEGQIEEIFNDPLTYEHALAYSNAEQRARIHSSWALKQQPQKDVSMAAEIEEDEFADDPEVTNCLLSPDEAHIKELIWVNQNKDWLRKHQEKIFKSKMEAERPKQTRRRRKIPRMGEGQTSPAGSALEAALNVVKNRGWSKRINYDMLRNIFDRPNGGGLGSVTTSRKTSQAGSTFGEEDGGDGEEEGGGAESVQGEQDEEQDEQDEQEEEEEEEEEDNGQADEDQGFDEFAGADDEFGGGEFSGGFDEDYGLDEYEE
ncbi:hypothetical protein CDD81_3476 [Ophiocordyceps australis]|uniref:Cyclin-like domain-containing protein n=1 Tax=Ophiocordyceps australis TaxID=1399860 RepID=A0A2C5XJP5_9HYPO|nr:hypothetical protein CDD81_3476 [Ophiocordyceps australis]